MKKLISGISALALAAAMAPMAAFARGGETKTLDKDKKSDTTTATYNVDATYTVTIPSAAVIADTEAAATAQKIEAKNVVLEEGQKIIVTLSGASNTTPKDTTFNAMTGKSGDMNRSTVKYKIKKTNDEEGTDIALNDKVAEFTGNQSVELKLIKDSTSTPTAAGAHTEQLTFSIATTNAPRDLSKEVFTNNSVTRLTFNYNGANAVEFTYNEGAFSETKREPNTDYTYTLTKSEGNIVFHIGFNALHEDWLDYTVTIDLSDLTYSIENHNIWNGMSFNGGMSVNGEDVTLTELQ